MTDSIPTEKEAREIAVIIQENQDGKSAEELAMEMYDWMKTVIRQRNQKQIEESRK